MSQLENMPGGFAALSNMYHNVQEPMMEAQQAGRESESSNGTRNSGGTDGATGAAMPNPWGSPPSNANRSSGSSTTTSNRNSAAPAQQSNPFAAMTGGGGANPFAGAGEMANNPWAIGGGQSGENNAGMPGFPGMGMGGMPPPNMDQMQQMLENPAMSEMMRNMVDSNPDMIRSMLEAQNPMFAQMFGGNTEMANNFIRNMFNPENMRNMMQMQRNSGAMGGGGGGGMPFGMPPMGGNMGGGEGLDFSSLLQQFQNTGLGSAAAAGANAPPSNPADRYRNQLQQLYGMGFDDEQANLAALQAAHGNLNRAVDQLLSAPPAPSPAPAGNTNADTTSNSDSPSSAGSKDEAEKKND